MKVSLPAGRTESDKKERYPPFTSDSYENGGSSTVDYTENIADSPFDFSVTIEKGAPLSVTYSLQYGEAEDESENNFASIDENGQLTITGPGTVTITATQAGDNNYGKQVSNHSDREKPLQRS